MTSERDVDWNCVQDCEGVGRRVNELASLVYGAYRAGCPKAAGILVRELRDALEIYQRMVARLT